LTAVVSHWIGGNDNDWSDRPAWPRAFFALFVIFLIALGISRIVRKAAAPYGDVMSAADRVAAGDYSVRVEPRGGGSSRRLIDSFNEMSARLESNENQRRQLLADVAHELRTPLAVVRGNVEGMLDGVYPRDDAHLLPLLDETAQMARLLDDLRTLSVAEAGMLRLHKEPTNLAALVDDLIGSFASQATTRGVTMASRTEPLPDLDVDPVRLREILANLVQNALRYTPAGGTIRIGASQSADRRRVSISVADTGSGIAPEDLPFVFDRFTKSSDSGGSGLGLAIAKRLVEAHSGTIAVTSDPGVKTVFRIEIPMETG
jgi:two-component system OmpR family sensor kinase/two-component system sensor histidine kinase BaeS